MNGCEPFRYPRSLIEQLRRIAKDAVVDLNPRATEPLQRGCGIFEQRRRRIVAKKLQQFTRRHAKARNAVSARDQAFVLRRAANKCRPDRIPAGAIQDPIRASAQRNCAKIETQSSVRQAGTTPRVLIAPRAAFTPTMLLNAAGILPEPASIRSQRERDQTDLRPQPRSRNSIRPKYTAGRSRSSTRRTVSAFPPDRWRTDQDSFSRPESRPPRSASQPPRRIFTAGV